MISQSIFLNRMRSIANVIHIISSSSNADGSLVWFAAALFGFKGSRDALNSPTLTCCYCSISIPLTLHQSSSSSVGNTLCQNLSSENVLGPSLFHAILESFKSTAVGTNHKVLTLLSDIPTQSALRYLISSHLPTCFIHSLPLLSSWFHTLWFLYEEISCRCSLESICPSLQTFLSDSHQSAEQLSQWNDEPMQEFNSEVHSLLYSLLSQQVLVQKGSNSDVSLHWAVQLRQVGWILKELTSGLIAQCVYCGACCQVETGGINRGIKEESEGAAVLTTTEHIPSSTLLPFFQQSHQVHFPFCLLSQQPDCLNQWIFKEAKDWLATTVPSTSPLLTLNTSTQVTSVFTRHATMNNRRQQQLLELVKTLNTDPIDCRESESSASPSIHTVLAELRSLSRQYQWIFDTQSSTCLRKDEHPSPHLSQYELYEQLLVKVGNYLKASETEQQSTKNRQRRRPSSQQPSIPFNPSHSKPFTSSSTTNVSTVSRSSRYSKPLAWKQRPNDKNRYGPIQQPSLQNYKRMIPSHRQHVQELERRSNQFKRRQRP